MVNNNKIRICTLSRIKTRVRKNYLKYSFW